MGKRKRINLSNEITVRALKLKPGEPQQVRFRDLDRMGFSIRVTQQSKKTWQYRYPDGNGSYRYLILGSFPKVGCAEAITKYEHYREQVKDYGVDPKLNVAGGKQSLSELFDQHYIPRYAKIKKKTWKEDEDIFELHVRGLIGSRKANLIVAADIEKVVGTLERDGKLHTARKTRAVLNKMFNWATSRSSALQPGGNPLLDIKNPCVDVKPEKPEPSDKRALRHHELKTIWNHLGDKKCIDRIIKILILTGSRISEITELHSDEIDWVDQRIILQPDRTRNKRLHVLPLTPRLLGIIGSKTTGFIFPARSKSGHTTSSGTRVTFTKYCKQLGIEHASPHDFRDTFISRTAEIGIGRALRDRLTNHADLSVDGRHYNAYEYYDEKLEALLKWDKALQEIVTSN
jgi:integrase